MFFFRINYNFIILFLTLLFISSCNKSTNINPKITLVNIISKTTLTNKKIIVNQINRKKKSIVTNGGKNIVITNDVRKITKRKLNLLDSIASNVINKNDVVFEFRNERLLQGRENSNSKQIKKEKKALTAVLKMLKGNTNLENHDLNLKNNNNIKHSIDYSLKSKKFLNFKNILVFLPFTGPYSKFGNKIRQAIDLSVLRFGSEKIKVIYFDTGTNYLLEEVESLIKKTKPGLVLGPFTRASVLKLKPYVKNYSIPMFAFTNDIALVEKNVWSLGFSPEEQIDSIMSCALDKGYKNYGFIAPNDLYGKIILDRSIDNISVKTNSSFKQLLLSNSEMKNKSKLESILKNFLGYNEENKQISFSKFDAIFIGGNKNFILEIAPLLAFYDVDSKKVQILGTEIFDDNTIKNEPSLNGAWFPKLLDREERNKLINKNNNKHIHNNLNPKRQKILEARNTNIKQKDFKLIWQNTWNNDNYDSHLSRVGFDAGILAINFLNQKKPIEEYIKSIEGFVTGFKFTENGYVKKAKSIVEIENSGKVEKKICFYNNLTN